MTASKSINWKMLLNIPIVKMEDEKGDKWIINFREQGKYFVKLEGEEEYIEIEENKQHEFRKRIVGIRVEVPEHLCLNE